MWTKTNIGNEILENEKEDFYISYNHSVMETTGIEIFEADVSGSSETAIVANGKYYILNGDFKKEYEALVEQGLDKCIEFYNQHKELHSTWSKI